MSDINDEVAALLLSSRCSMFHPGTRMDLLISWPELREVASFMELKGRPKDMLFAYFYACKMSYAQRLTDDTKRIRFALDAAYDGKAEKKLREAYLNHKWGADIDDAIEDMRRFEPSVRVKNKIHAERLLRNVEWIARTDFSEGDAPEDWEEKQRALRAIREAAELIPVIQKLAEGDFGISIVAKEEETPGAKWAEVKHIQHEEV